ncbi:TPA: hypothetical protein N0F65_012138 [Lagenidium giganteum]|uniref:RBR-type E3 ubiquitin transferase n=1 Tax=Lagenidium giganteum TaxID=4803 RepID=A0AAV2YJV1_9STRA|nr:TPA: hypothetical protein N0F65_012138 [Lagenidium giganteum]
MTVFKHILRGCRRLAAKFVPQHCAICLEMLPFIGQRETSNTNHATFSQLSCGHRFCTECVRQYVKIKINSREVDTDQLTCPIVECRAPIVDVEVELIAGSASCDQYLAILKRKRDEKHPNARWCPRPGCEELIVCSGAPRFTCPKCNTEGCFKCGEAAHWLWFCRRTIVDQSYVEWEKSVGAVRGCPGCGMRIWKNEGCNHMTCTRCRHEYCWVCDSPWDPSHYACYEVPFMRSSPVLRRSQLVVGYLGIFAIVLIIVLYGFTVFAFYYLIICLVVRVLQRIRLTIEQQEAIRAR